MEYTLSEARSSPVAMGPELGSFGAGTGTPMWWLGVAGAVVAVLVTVGSRLRGD